jgi:VanZ family protein
MGILYWLSSIPGTSLPDDPAHYALLQWISPSVQNTLHVPAFAVLSGTWCWALQAWLRAPVVRLAAAFAIAAAYGVFDEWHQSFVPGRYASLTDVALDVVGAALGVWLAIRFWTDGAKATAAGRT